MTKYLLDTNQIIDHLRGRNEIKELLLELLNQGNIICSCSITIVEIYAGVKPKETDKTKKLLDSFWFLETTKEISEMAGKIKQKYSQKGITLSLADTIIAAIAIAHNAVLITSNAKDFPKGLVKIISMRG